MLDGHHLRPQVPMLTPEYTPQVMVVGETAVSL